MGTFRISSVPNKVRNMLESMALTEPMFRLLTALNVLGICLHWDLEVKRNVRVSICMMSEV